MLSGSIFQKDTRISVFISELHHNDWGGSKFYHVACPPRGKSATKEKTAKRKQYLVDFHPRKIGYKSHTSGGGGGGRNSTISPFLVGNSAIEKS